MKVLELITVAWRWASGKKTNIGTVLLIASAIIQQVVMGIWGISGEALLSLSQTFDWFGMALGGVGLVHKYRKAKNGK